MLWSYKIILCSEYDAPRLRKRDIAERPESSPIIRQLAREGSHRRTAWSIHGTRRCSGSSLRTSPPRNAKTLSLPKTREIAWTTTGKSPMRNSIGINCRIFEKAQARASCLDKKKVKRVAHLLQGCSAEPHDRVFAGGTESLSSSIQCRVTLTQECSQNPKRHLPELEPVALRDGVAADFRSGRLSLHLLCCVSFASSL